MWQTSKVTTLFGTFALALDFNGNLSMWQTSRVRTLFGTFAGARDFNQNIGSWQTSSVTDMSHMYHKASAFDQNLGNWDTSSVTDMKWMFRAAYAFDQCLEWDLDSLTMTKEMFEGSPGGLCGICQKGEFFSLQSLTCERCSAGSMACDGSSFCLNGADSSTLPACSTCYSGDFMINNRCRKCPSYVGQYLWILAAFVAFVACWLIYHFSGGEVDMSVLSISTAHFQFITIYFSLALEYPDFVVKVMHWLAG